ncbi:hypothetical protein RI103_02280 [Paraburkholderia sp. FT54]|uniref:hypothetical protein n=1 Tax=Paraburkholderia sp. FT54 TaxID=3074437 RepID=UPI00287770EE|nr:hypothetical protein [Paraburkholderia sp. FT54]WNC90210.1 hypothetical protein RI103_02280 [Paraburkholderia sp. FT54]
MTDSGWDIAMSNIDAEYDIPQFVASSLVHKIAASGFRLPAADRGKFERLPDDVIARIEHIVVEAYLEAGEDVGEEILREDLWQQALISRRDMVANGELVPEDSFRERLGVTPRRLSKLLTDGSVFTMLVDNVEYYPALLADPVADRKRLQAICRILIPAPPDARFDYLSSRRGSLGGVRPTDMLNNDSDYEKLRRMARAWAAEWSRTAVKLFEGEHDNEPGGADPLYTAIAEVDPRRPLWERASEALHVHGYEWPLGPYPEARTFTLFVERQAVGDSTPTPEACIQVSASDDFIRVRVRHCVETVPESQATLPAKSKTVVDVAKKVIAHFCKR